MTSDPCNRAPKQAAPAPYSHPSKPNANAGRNRRHPCKKRRSRRAADRAKTPTFRRPIPARLYDNAEQKGFVLIGRGRRSADMQLQCKTCDQLMQVRRSVLINNTLECKNCLWMRRIDDAMASGATIHLPHPNNHKIATLVLSCGHHVQRQYNRIAIAANGGHALGCETCREVRYALEAEGSGWVLVGPALPAKINYRHYVHHCGHGQDHAIVNVDNRQLDCANCGETWASKPSCIYLFRIELSDRAVLKFGYSSDPARRLRQQLGEAARKTGKILRVIDLETGHAALKAEKKAHRTLRRTHGAFVVATDVFAGQIKTKSEIYTLAAEPIIHELMDEIEDASSNAGASASPQSPRKAKSR